MWRSSLLPEAIARAFAPLPTEPIWRWAERTVWLDSKTTAEPGFYRSARTPWNRRLHDLYQSKKMWVFDFAAGQWITHRVSEVNDLKSSQAGVSETCLNLVRYAATFSPHNVIYTIDTRENAVDMSERLRPTLERLDANIFTGDDDDVGTFTMRLLSMDVWFQGSFSTGKFAGKQAPLVIADELEEHPHETKDTSTATNLKSRKKAADDGLQINLSKPKLVGGPIHKGHQRGNREAYCIQCPHCQAWQPLTFFRNEDEKNPHPVLTPYSEEIHPIRHEQTGEIVYLLPVPLPYGETRKLRTGRLVFEHCKDIFGRWDDLRILREVYYECAHCLGHIEEYRKADLVDAGAWLPTHLGTPGIVSQHISDLYSSDANSTWGHIVLEYLQAKREGVRELQGFYNHRLGLPWWNEIQKFSHDDVKSNVAGRAYYFLDYTTEKGLPRREVFDKRDLADQAHARLTERKLPAVIRPSVCPPYKRGTIPFVTYPAEKSPTKKDHATLILGGDVGGNYARWGLGVLAQNLEDIAVIDWGEEIDPDAIAELMRTLRWPMAANPQITFAIQVGFLDSKFRKTECWKACLSVPGGALVPSPASAAAPPAAPACSLTIRSRSSPKT